MKRLIRNKATGKFLARDGQWTPDHRAALVFPDIKALCAVLQTLDVEGLESVLQAGEEPSKRYDVVVPLPFRDPESGKPWCR